MEINHAQKQTGASANMPPRNPDGTFRSTGLKPKEPLKRRKKAKKLLERLDVETVIAGLQEGTLDRRTKTSIAFEAIKLALEDDPSKVAAELLRHDIAVYAVISRAILQYAQDKQGRLVTENGELLPLLRNDLPRFQAAMTKAVDSLMRLEGKATAKGAEDVADIVLGLESTV